MPISTILENMGAAYETRYFKHTPYIGVMLVYSRQRAWFGGFGFLSFLFLHCWLQ